MVYSESQFTQRELSLSHIKHAFRFMGRRPLHFNSTVCFLKKKQEGVNWYKDQSQANREAARNEMRSDCALVACGCYKWNNGITRKVRLLGNVDTLLWFYFFSVEAGAWQLSYFIRTMFISYAQAVASLDIVLALCNTFDTIIWYVTIVIETTTERNFIIS